MEINKHSAGSSIPRLQWETDDEVLAYYLAIARYGGKELPHTVQEELERIALAAGSNPVFAARLDAISRRMDDLDGEGVSGEFERLTGHKLPGSTAEVGVDRPPQRASSRRRRGLVVTACASIVAATFLLWSALVGGPGYADLASVEPAMTISANGVVLRGRPPAEQDLALLRFREAHAVLSEAEGRWLGLFRRYDRDRVTEAMVLLDDARSMTDPDAPAYAAASYLLAKAYLAVGDLEGARGVLKDAAAGTGPYALEAIRLNERIEERAGTAP